MSASTQPDPNDLSQPFSSYDWKTGAFWLHLVAVVVPPVCGWLAHSVNPIMATVGSICLAIVGNLGVAKYSSGVAAVKLAAINAKSALK